MCSVKVGPRPNRQKNDEKKNLSRKDVGGSEKKNKKEFDQKSNRQNSGGSSPNTYKAGGGINLILMTDKCYSNSQFVERKSSDLDPSAKLNENLCY